MNVNEAKKYSPFEVHALMFLERIAKALEKILEQDVYHVHE